MKKAVIGTLVAAFILSGTQAFAQGKIVKNLSKLNSAQLERMIARSSKNLVPHVPGVYIPAGTTMGTLERQMVLAAKRANTLLSKAEIHIIASNPTLLNKFQSEIGSPIFRSLPSSALKINQEKFALARANGDYEEVWANFAEKSELAQDIIGRSVRYYSMGLLATDVSLFSVEHIGLKNLPRVKKIADPQLEGVVCEIPVDELFVVRPDSLSDDKISADNFVVLRYDNGEIDLIDRGELEKSFRVIQ